MIFGEREAVKRRKFIRFVGGAAAAWSLAARLLELGPAFTISAWIAQGGRSNAKLLIEGLRKAGLPE